MRLLERVVESRTDVITKLVDFVILVCADLMVFTDVRSAISGVLSAASPLNVENWLIKLGEFDLLSSVEAICLAGSNLFVGVSS